MNIFGKIKSQIGGIPCSELNCVILKVTNSFCVFLSVAQVLEEDKEHGPLVTVCHVLQEKISLDSTGRACRYKDKQITGFSGIKTHLMTKKR